MLKAIALALGLITTTIGFATNGTCTITLNKSKCWNNFSVAVSVIDTKKNTTLGIININKNESTVQKQISCASGQTLQYSATFKPIMWRDEANKIYLYSYTAKNIM